MVNDEKLGHEYWEDTRKRYAKKSPEDLISELEGDILTLVCRKEAPDLPAYRAEMHRIFHALDLIRGKLDDGEPYQKKTGLTLDDLPYMADVPEGFYKRYDNCDAIEVPRTKYIPLDYDGVMGVPISALDNASVMAHMEIVGYTRPKLNGKGVYYRILVRWIWSEQLNALWNDEPVEVEGIYHDAAQWSKDHGIELKIKQEAE